MKQFASISAAIFAAAISTSAFAQDATPAAGTSQAADANAMSAAAGAAGQTGATSGTQAGKPAKGNPDQNFVNKATIGGLFEVKSSEMAQQKATSDKVKQFAQQMITDHGKANQELTGLAQQKQLQQPADLDQKHSDLLKKLESATGADFDKQYSEAQLGAHKEAVQLFEGASKRVKDADLKSWAEKTLPTLKTHLDAAKKLNEGNGSADEKKDKM